MVSSKIFRKTLLVGAVVLLATGGLQAAKSARKPNATGLLGSIPARSIFCVRVNNLDGTLETVNEFLKGVTPESFDADAAVVSKLGKMLGDEKLRGVNRKQNLAIFAVNVPGEKSTAGPMGNMFIGALLPVRNYDNFVSKNPNCSQPDDEGISTITIDGRPRALVAQYRRFALVCPPGAREKMIRVKKMLGQRKQSLAMALDDDQKKQAAGSPLWVYLNVKQGSGLIQPMVFGGLQKMKAQLQKAKEKGEKLPVDPTGIVDFYGGIVKIVLEGTDHITVTLAPSAEACTVTLGLKAVPDTTMAAIVGEPLSGDFGNKLGYLDDGALFNLCGKVDRKSMKTAYLELIELIGKMIPEGLSETDMEQLRGLTTKGIDAMGDTLSISFKAGEGSPPFAGRYVIEVRDQAAFEQVLEEELKLMEKGVLADMYKGFGMEMDVEINRNAGTYKGTRIGGAKVMFKMGDEDSPPAQMLGKMFGDGLTYRWAFTAGHCVYTLGPEADNMIRELIDQVRAGGPEHVGSQMKAALAVLGDRDKADVVGTFNFVRYMQMVAGFMATAAEAEVPEFDTPTTSNIAFAGRTTEAGALMFQIVMPKAHLLETQSVFKKVIPKIEEQQRQQRQKQKERAQANNM